MKALLQITTVITLVGYPFAVYLGLQYLSGSLIAIVLCALLIIRLGLSKAQAKPMLIPILVGIGLTAGSFIAKKQDWLLFYPVVINLTMLGLFSYSLYKGPCMIERFARLKHADLPLSAIPYLQKVTKIWCLFFILNGAVALYTALACTLETWTLYNGFIAYLLMATLLGGEWIYRRFWLLPHE